MFRSEGPFCLFLFEKGLKPAIIPQYEGLHTYALCPLGGLILSLIDRPFKISLRALFE